MSILKELANAMTSTMTKNTNKLRHVNVDDLIKVIKSNIQAHNDLANTIGTLPDSDMVTIYRDIVAPELKSIPELNKVYTEYLRKLNGNAKHMEAKVPLSSFQKAHEAFGPIMQSILSQVNELFENDQITIFNIRMSQAAIMGIIKQSTVTINFTTMLFTSFTAIATNTYDGMPKYRVRYMGDKVEPTAVIVSNICDKKGPYTLLDEIKQQKRQHYDVVLGATGKFDFLSHLTTRKFSISFLDNLATFLSSLNFFSSAIEAWDDYILDKHARNKEAAEWLRNRVTLLRMRLEDMDETSPEYQNQIRIIKNYEDKITDYDARILKFEEED